MGMTFQDTLLINIKVITAQAQGAISRVEKQLAMLQRKANLAVKLSGLGVTMKKDGQLIDNTTQKVATQQEIMQKMIEKTTNKATQGLRKSRGEALGFGLSMLFTGMAIKKLGESILNSLVKTYMKATDEQSRFNQELLAVQAAFEFLKFSIMDSLGQSELVIGFIEGLINMVNWISAFISKRPMIALFIGTFAILSVVLGTVAMAFGQLFLLSVGLGISFGATLGILVGIVVVAGLLVLLFALSLGYLKKHPAQVKALEKPFNNLMDSLKGVWQLIVDIADVFEFDLSNSGKTAVALVGAGMDWLANKINNVVASSKALGVMFAFIGRKASWKDVTDAMDESRKAAEKATTSFGSLYTAQVEAINQAEAIELGKKIGFEEYKFGDRFQPANQEELGFSSFKNAEVIADQMSIMANLPQLEQTNIIGESQLKEMTFQNDLLDSIKLSNDDILKELESTKNELESKAGQTNNFDIAISGIAGDNDSLAEFIKQTINDTLDEANNRNNGAPQGG